MARFSSFLVASILVATIAACSAVTPEAAANAEEWAVSATAHSSLQGIVSGDKHEHMPFTLLTKYLVRPSHAKDFAKGWLKFREVVNHANGSRTINLSKPMNNNLVFYSYEEWDCMGAFVKFVKHNWAAHELIDYITEHDIPIEFTQLVSPIPGNTPDMASVSDTVSQVAGMSFRALETLLGEAQGSVFPKKVVFEKSTLGKESVRNHTLIVLSKYLVKPSQLGQFVKAADLVTKAVSANEKGNLVYALSKPLDDDVTFWTYAIWEDKEAFMKHVSSSYVKLFLKYILEHDIYVKSTPLLAVEHMK